MNLKYGLLLVCVFVSCRGLTTSGLPLSLTTATDAPDATSLQLELPRFGSPNTWNVKSEHGNVVLLDVWATWCDPCRPALQAYQSLLAEFSQKNVKVLGVNVDADVSLIGPFLTEHNITIPVLLDTEAKLSGPQLKISIMPTCVIIDKQGVIRFRHEGFDVQELPLLRKEIEQLLAEGDSTVAPK